MGIFPKWSRSRGAKRGLSSKIFSSARPSIRPNRRESISGARPSYAADLFIWGMIALVAGYILLFSPFLIVDRISISGLSRLEEQDVRATVMDELDGCRFFVWPRNNFFAIDPDRLSAFLLERYPLLRSVSVVRRFPRTLAIEGKERERIVLWRGTGAEDLVLGEDGRLFRNASALSEENAPHIVTVTDLSAKEAKEGDRVSDDRFVPFVSVIGDEAAGRLGLVLGKGYSVTSRFAGELRMATAEGWDLYVSTELPIASTLDALALLFEKELPAEKRSGLRYIDMRIENRAYYAFRNAPERSVQSSEAPDEKKAADDEKKKKK